jgi:fatty-acyl-CoA synthase
VPQPSTPDHPAVIHGALRYSYAELYARARRLASALAARGIGKGDTVSAMLANTPPMIECHYGVPMTGAVLNTLNTRLDAATIAFALDHAETKVLITDREFSGTIKEALARAKARPLVVDYDDLEFAVEGERLGEIGYEEFIAAGDPQFAWRMPDDEWDAISLNYTSGTTGNPKGVVYHHRGAYLLAQGNIITAVHAQAPGLSVDAAHVPLQRLVLSVVHLGRCRHPRVPAPGARQAIWEALAEHGVTHMCGAPIVMATILGAPEEEKRRFPTRSSSSPPPRPPPEAVLAAMADAGFNVTHIYGLTETYGPPWSTSGSRSGTICRGLSGPP